MGYEQTARVYFIGRLETQIFLRNDDQNLASRTEAQGEVGGGGHSRSWRSTHRKNMCSRRTSQPVRSARERTCNTPHIDTPFMLRERTCNTRHTDTPLMLRERTCNTQHTDTPLMLRWPVDAIRPIVARGTPKVNRDYRRTISRAALGRPRLLTAAARTSSTDNAASRPQAAAAAGARR